MGEESNRHMDEEALMSVTDCYGQETVVCQQVVFALESRPSEGDRARGSEQGTGALKQVRLLADFGT